MTFRVKRAKTWRWLPRVEFGLWWKGLPCEVFFFWLGFRGWCYW